MKKRMILLLVIVSLAAMFGCAEKKQEALPPLKTTSETQKANLTKRQKEILADNDLPTEYNELSLSQKNAIKAIEEMLVYLENKYEIPFEYKEYIAPFGVEQEQLLAYPASGEYTRKCVTVTTTKQGYQDDYIAAACTDLFAAYLEQGVKGLCPGIKVKVYPKITRMDLEEIPKDEKDFDGNVGSSVVLFADDASCTQENFNQLKMDFENWMQQHELYGIVRMLLVKQDAMQQVTEYNFTDYLTEEHYLLDLELSVQPR